MKAYHRFAYPAPLNLNEEEPRPFKTRDGAAFNELTAGFPAFGYQYGSLIYNYPFSPHLAPDHIQDLASLAARIAKPSPKDEVAKFLAEDMSEGVRNMLRSVCSNPAATAAQREAQKQVLLDELNEYIDGEPLYTETRFKGLRLSPATETLRSHSFLGKKEVARLNRYLLEDAFPQELAPIHDTLKLGPQNFSFLRGDRDVLVLTTRPPLDDERHEDKKFVARSHTDLESAAFESLRRCIQICARNRVRIATGMAQHLTGKAIQKVEMRFHQKNDGRMVEFLAPDQPKPSSVPASEYLTAGFLVHLPKIERYGCELIASFGMGGIETLIWNRIVRNHPQYQSWITKPVFVVAELDLRNLPTRPITLHFVDQIKVDILLQLPLQPA
jgi:hypothetical protein